jgi:hypothetical protein
MKTFLVLILVSVFSSSAMSQDKMLKHSGETLEVKIIKVGEVTISFKYPGEDAEQTISKLAVESITYGGSGRKEEISEKVVVLGKPDWEKVQILTDPSQVVGLKKGIEVKGKTSGVYSMHTAGSAERTATKRIKEDAAEVKASFILIATDKTDNFGVKQSIKKGITYTYN